MNKPLKIDKYLVHYHNKEELLELKKEIFSQHTYYFDTENPQPRIIDAGSHIGLATLYFKKQYPLAQITAIEPHPTNFKLLEENVWENGLDDVTCLNAALGDHNGTVSFHADAAHSWLSTASLHQQAWNGDQKTQPITVQALTLSSLLTQPTDLVKLDIEGVELAVLTEAAHTLFFAKKMLIEFHPRSDNTFEDVTNLLKDHNFELKFSKQGGQISPQRAQHGLVMIEATHRSTVRND